VRGAGTSCSTHHHWRPEIGHAKRAVPSHGRRREGVIGRALGRMLVRVSLCRWRLGGGGGRHRLLHKKQ